MIDPRIVAHRGFTADETENTIAALTAACTLGCRAVEFDVHTTKDGRWVVHHDPDLRRIHGLDVTIAETSLADLRRAAPIATLPEALTALDEGCRPMVEVKETTSQHFDALAEDLAPFEIRRPMVIVRGDLPAAARAALPPSIPIYLFELDWEAALARRDEPIDGYDLHHEPIDPAEIASACERVRALGRGVAVWTVNDPARARLWLEAGATWVITDHPDRFPES